MRDSSTVLLFGTFCGMLALTLVSGCQEKPVQGPAPRVGFEARGKFYFFRCDKTTRQYDVLDDDGNTVISGTFTGRCIAALATAKTRLEVPASSASSGPMARSATSPAAGSSGPLVYILDVDNQNAVRILDPATITFKSVFLPDSGYPVAMALTPDEKSLWVLQQLLPNGSVTIIDTATQAVTGNFPLPITRPTSIAISPDGATAYITSGEESTGVGTLSTVLVVDTVSHAVRKTISTPQGSGPAVLTPDGLLLYTIGDTSGPNALTVVDTTTNTVAASLNLANALDIFVNPTGTRVYIPTFNSVLVFDTATNQQLASIPLTGGNLAATQIWLDFSPSDQFVWLYSGHTGLVFKIDAITNQIVSTVTVPGALFGFMFMLPG